MVFKTTRKFEDKLWQIAIITKRSPEGVMVDLYNLIDKLLIRDQRFLRLLPKTTELPSEFRLLNVSGQQYRRLRLGSRACQIEVPVFLFRCLLAGSELWGRAASRKKSWRFTKEELLKEALAEIALTVNRSA